MMNGWIKNLKPGDEVFAYGGRSGVWIVKIDKVSSDGTPWIGSCSFDLNGFARGATNIYSHIEECTAEKKEKFRQNNFISKVEEMIIDVIDQGKLTYDKAIAIKSILD